MWNIIVTAVGVYNIAKKAYDIYKDVGGIKQQYRQYQSLTREYRQVQGQRALTDTQYVRHKEQFMFIESPSTSEDSVD